MHVHVSFLTPFVVFFSLLIIGPIIRTLALAWRSHPAGQALGYAVGGF